MSQFANWPIRTSYFVCMYANDCASYVVDSAALKRNLATILGRSHSAGPDGPSTGHDVADYITHISLLVINSTLTGLRCQWQEIRALCPAHSMYSVHTRVYRYRRNFPLSAARCGQGVPESDEIL